MDNGLNWIPSPCSEEAVDHANTFMVLLFSLFSFILDRMFPFDSECVVLASSPRFHDLSDQSGVPWFSPLAIQLISVSY